MSSTEADATLAALFDEVLMPIARQMQAEGVQAFARAPDVSWLSYYVRRRRSAMEPADFALPAIASPAELEQQLAAHWQALGRHRLAAQAGAFAQAAAQVKAEYEAAGAGPALSPYVYAMF